MNAIHQVEMILQHSGPGRELTPEGFYPTPMEDYGEWAEGTVVWLVMRKLYMIDMNRRLPMGRLSETRVKWVREERLPKEERWVIQDTGLRERMT